MNKEMSLNEKLEKLMDRFEETEEKIDFNSEFKTDYDADWYVDIRDALTEYETIKKLEHEHCPFKIVIKALLNGIAYESIGLGNTNWGNKVINFSKTPKLKLDYETHTLLCFEVSGSNCRIKKCLYLKDYKKTWWLRKDKSE